ncbi:SusC/RagA family TonB-linked outer membrane protein [Bacteroides caccae]|nr:TonB-dependent receptor [Bacteroides caccae]MBT9925021.1 SusC/RagA family TonB-linked outer membrane protein [Bacteroides caccae]CCZ74258.1 susC/RagA family TonB-linked outer membrane protein [Bacteroides caccae CAG:21]
MKKSSLIDLNVFRKVLIGLGISSSLFYPNNALADSYLTSKNEVTTTVQQTKKITGNVTNTAGEPIIGATVLEKGNTTNGTITDIDGNFTINLPANATLSISYIGYITQEIQVGYQTSFKVVLKDDTKTLDEIIVVGYGSQKKANLTGAVSSVKMDEALGDRPLLNAADALQGAVPGLFVSNGGNAPGTSKSFQIRGAYSLGVKNSDGTYGNTIKPLVLIDNVEGDIDMINPEDIESINVLKDAASAAIYGARAAGGVILVTTKRPKGASRFELNYNNNFAFGKAVNLPKQAPLMDYLQAYLDCGYSDAYWSLGSPSVSKWMEYLTAYQKDPSSFNTVGDGIYVDESGVPYYLNEKDLYKNFMETSFQMTHNISVSGGTDKLRYRISGGYNSNDGVLISDRDKFERMNVNSFISADVTKWFTQEITMSYAHSLQTSPGGMGGVYNTRLVSYYPEGELPASVNTLADEDLPLFTPRNQILYSNPVNNKNDNPRIFLKSILKPLKGLEAVFEYTFDKNIYDYHWYTGQYDYTTIQGGSSKSFVDDYLRKYKQHTNYNSINVYATYNKDFGNHHFKVMAGFNQESSYQETLDTYSYNQAVLDVPAMSSGTGTIKATDSYSEYAIRGGFFRVNYNYLDKYLLEVNGRYDGSSKFPKSSRFGFFPSVSAGWQIAQERFMNSTRHWLDGLKLRASYGVIGNQNINPYTFTPSMSVNNKATSWIIDDTYVTSISSLPALVSQNFTWEKVGTINVGLDVNLFNNRLSGVFEWYQRNTNGMLAPGVQLPAVVGASAPYQNTADMRTRGWELSLNWRDQIGKVGYRIGFNLSDYKSEIIKYDDNAATKLLSSYYPGQTLGEIWGYVVDGYYTVDDFVDTSSWQLKEGVTSINGYNVRPGDVKFKNLRDDDTSTNVITSGDNTFDNPGDRKVIGNTTPRYQYGINLGMNYAGFDLNVILQGTGKRDYWISNVLTFPMNGDNFVPLFEGLSDYWMPKDPDNGDWSAVNPNAKYPRIYGNRGNSGSNLRQSDKYLSDASYLRIKNITLSYKLPKKWVNQIFLNQMKAFVSIENVATFTSLPSGIDPERIEWNYPAFRTVSFGVNITL